jgi:hypothetical protein
LKGIIMKIVETDNFDGDYPDEKFLNLFNMPEEAAKKICKVINEAAGENCARYWKVVPDDYALQPGFQP